MKTSVEPSMKFNNYCRHLSAISKSTPDLFPADCLNDDNNYYFMCYMTQNKQT